MWALVCRVCATHHDRHWWIFAKQWDLHTWTPSSMNWNSHSLVAIRSVFLSLFFSFCSGFECVGWWRLDWIGLDLESGNFDASRDMIWGGSVCMVSSLFFSLFISSQTTHTTQTQCRCTCWVMWCLLCWKGLVLCSRLARSIIPFPPLWKWCSLMLWAHRPMKKRFACFCLFVFASALLFYLFPFLSFHNKGARPFCIIRCLSFLIFFVSFSLSVVFLFVLLLVFSYLVFHLWVRGSFYFFLFFLDHSSFLWTL